MNVFITGGTGFVGKNLISMFVGNDFHVTSVSSSPIRDIQHDAKITYISADTTKGGDWQAEVQKADIIVNLAGRSIFHYWNKAYKQKIYDSRILTTQNIVNALPDKKNALFINASAAGFYGDRGDTVLTESSSPGTDFLAKVCQDWEKEAFRAEEKGARVVITRFGVVLGGNGGALGIMSLPYRFFVGGPIGTGKQWFPWIHVTDLVSAYQTLINDDSASGVYNLTAPQPVQNREMAKIMGKIMRRPSFLTLPKFAIKLVMGEFGSLLLYSQRAVPEKLLKEDFQFIFPDIASALSEVLAKSP